MLESNNNGHRQRLRKRAANYGFESLENHEFLEMLLFYAIPRKNTNQIAHELIARFGSLKGVFNASVEELENAGLSRRAAVWINFISYYSEIYKLLFITKNNVQTLNHHNFAGVMLYHLRYKSNKRILLIMIDSAGVIVQTSVISILDDPKETIRNLCEAAAASKAPHAIIAFKRYNSGLILDNRYISNAEVYIGALRTLGVHTIDCVIVDDCDLYSFRDHEMM